MQQDAHRRRHSGHFLVFLPVATCDRDLNLLRHKDLSLPGPGRVPGKAKL
jgi:hypothetical protein